MEVNHHAVDILMYGGQLPKALNTSRVKSRIFTSMIGLDNARSYQSAYPVLLNRVLDFNILESWPTHVFILATSYVTLIADYWVQQGYIGLWNSP